MARRVWPGRGPLGQRINLGGANSPSAWTTIVGVVADIRHEVYDRSPRSIVYLPYAQEPPGKFDLVFRMRSGQAPPVSRIQSEIFSAGQDVQILHTASLAERMAEQSADLRWIAGLIGVLGGIAAALSSVGVYGVVSQSIVARRQELGVRMAVGASQTSILQTILAGTIRLAIAALSAGVLLALVLARLLASFFYGTSVWTVSSFAEAYLLLFFVSVAASIIPAWRATRLDVTEALRYR